MSEIQKGTRGEHRVRSCWCDRMLAESGQLDQRVRSMRAERYLEPNSSIL
jgi:hypothetical protein